MGDPLSGQGPTSVGAKASPVRLVVLLAILALMVGALGFDLLVAKPAMEAANLKLEQEATRRIAAGLDAKLTVEQKGQKLKDSLLDNLEVQKLLNKTPAKVEVHNEQPGDEYTVETYRYWGYLPLNRHYLSVVYRGKAPNLRYNAHFPNSPPPADQLPGFERLAVEDPNAPPGSTEAGATTPSGKMGGSAMAGGKGGGKGKGKGKGGGSGLPPPGESAPAEVTPIAEGAPATDVTPKAPGAKDGAKPAEEKPATGKPVEEKPDASKPAAEKKDAEAKKVEGDKPADEKKTGE